MLVCFPINNENIQLPDLHTLYSVFLVLCLTVHHPSIYVSNIFSIYTDHIFSHHETSLFSLNITPITDNLSSPMEVSKALLLFAKGSNFATKVPLM